MDKNHFLIRKLSVEDLDQYDKLLRYAFQVTEGTLQESGWEDDDIRQSKFPILERASVLGCFDGDSLVSQLAVYPVKMNIHSGIYPVGFVTSVATYPEYAGMGLMSRLMKQSLTDMKNRGRTLALLYPYSIPLYRKRGWEIISDKMSYRIRDVQLPQHVEAPGYVRRVSEESPDLMHLHAQFAQQTHGCLFRNRLAWDEYWRWDEDDTTVAIYYNVEDTPLGYMVYLIKDDIMHIKEMIYLNSEARRGLRKYVAAHVSMIDEVRGNNFFSEPIAFSLEDSDIKEMIRPYIMGRIVDVEAFLRRYRFNPEARGGAVTLEVRDTFLEWNNRTFTIAVEGGKAVSRKSARNRASLSIGTLTAFLLGYKRARDLARLEMLQADEATLKLLDSMVIHEKPYISDYI